ncbi:Alpha-1,3-mannosyltransferase ALG2 [Wickerhamomyces ciferrii]|uniref:Alpha-1,3/1,6-mannosyltransferase ALG2 n=1 Tax=Wickerhamomyces ciferrii (strain ATCC 14091 / BCRC 22168 / CBS 111 / JCM 3599 / NBRC 0793 / NRRL Y-1031 F-60-10) TaxID=1206466 RepID=K0KVX0_WICCF|nr:Alpha-1,3-mannosyltransferase ALG2 [Wickerhamomyces ciferrii]CCH45649.1 Alpha-1,3-mannosyltransferase ALG2 [Wickerhamomyces ciferrii]
MRIAFIHPDLGIGGAERLIVDAALGLQNEGHEVQMFTSHCDKTHCFEELADGTLKVKVYGDFLPTNLLGRLMIVFATLRQLVLVLKLIISGEISEYDLFIVDQLSFCLPLLHLFKESRSKTLFYCHFPDQLLARRESFLKKLYRIPFDILEQFTTSTADSIVVNSNFTKTMYDKTFPYIKDFNIPDVIYPCVDLSKETITKETETIFNGIIGSKTEYFLSVNRFEKYKNIELAINSFNKFLESNPNSKVKLVVSGGYDKNFEGNKNYLKHLQDLVSRSNLLNSVVVFNNQYEEFSNNIDQDINVIFLPSISSNLKELLLTNTKLLLYTPSFEHFGIVPLEAMKFGIPVIAINNGGPVETIKSIDEDPENGVGWLEPSEPELWAKKLEQSLTIPKNKLISNGLKQLNSNFTLKVMTQDFEKQILKTLKKPNQSYFWEKLIYIWRLPIFIIARTYFKINAILVWGLTGITFLPGGIFQIIASVALISFYLVAPEYFDRYE